jgi:putative ABC transport system permease protein
MLTEAVAISIAGGAVGAVLASWSVDLLASLKPADLPRLASVRVDGWVLGFTLGISVVTGIVFGLLPSLSASRQDVNLALKESGRTVSGSGSMARLRGVLVVSEIALAIVLLAGAGLLIKGLWRLQSVDPGFKPENLLTLRIELPESRYREIPKQVQFRKAVLERLNSEPGIEAAAMISELPLTTDYLTHNFIIEGRPPIDPGAEPELPVRSVAGDYFGAMGIPLRHGRSFGPEDNSGSPVVGLVNETFARQYFPNEDPVGKRIAWARGTPRQWMTIIGVVGDIKQRRLNTPEEPAFYTSYYQQNQPWKRWMCVVARFDGDMQTALARVKSQIWGVDSQIPLTRVRSMREVMAGSIAETRFNTTMMGIFAGVALLLSAVGVYGVISYSVAQRTNEIGIRIALGATTRDVLAAVMRQGLLLTGLGIAAGLTISIVFAGVMERLLFGVGTRDPLTFAAISVVLALVALTACFIPARRATRVDPMVALRYE